MSRSMRLAVAGSLLAAASGCGAAGEHLAARAPTTTSKGAAVLAVPAASAAAAVEPRVAGWKATVVAVDPPTAARVAVRASSRRERVVVRRILVLLGRRDPIASVALTATGPGGKLATITVTPAGPAIRAEFEAMVVGDAISRQLPYYQWLQIGKIDGTRPGAPTTPTPIAADALGASVAAGVAAAGLTARSITVLALPVPAVETVIRLREEQLFEDPAPNWLAAVEAGPAGRPASGLTIVQTPQGATVSVAGHVGREGFASYGQSPTVPIPTSAPKVLYQRPTKLTITLQRSSFGALPETDIIWTLDCQHRYASTFTHPRAACDRVIRDRWALFAPQPNTACGGSSRESITIRGQLAGHPVAYGTGGCNSGTLERWERFLRVAPRVLP